MAHTGRWGEVEVFEEVETQWRLPLDRLVGTHRADGRREVSRVAMG